MTVSEPSARTWRKSSFSIPDGECCEVARTGGDVLVRDSKKRRGPELRFSATSWRAALVALRSTGLTAP
ncbi:DUF397 domain-containing protein [Streptomyces sp. B6B3]|uniref:DUF397 domain-containing protein n=1 Tax=Streptomyces sp. B6B3 TaxID=3153570 RepID=UPI00325D8EB4